MTRAPCCLAGVNDGWYNTVLGGRRCLLIGNAASAAIGIRARRLSVATAAAHSKCPGHRLRRRLPFPRRSDRPFGRRTFHPPTRPRGNRFSSLLQSARVVIIRQRRRTYTVVAVGQDWSREHFTANVAATQSTRTKASATAAGLPWGERAGSSKEEDQ